MLSHPSQVIHVASLSAGASTYFKACLVGVALRQPTAGGWERKGGRSRLAASSLHSRNQLPGDQVKGYSKLSLRSSVHRGTMSCRAIRLDTARLRRKAQEGLKYAQCQDNRRGLLDNSSQWIQRNSREVS